MFNNILIVCIGNICRSPMAEALFIHALRDKSRCNVYSAGLGALVGHASDPIACELMQAKGIDITTYRAMQLNTEMIRKADLILVMDTQQKMAINAQEPSAKGKVFRLGQWDNFDVPDPYRKDLAAFTSALQLIERGVEQWLQKI